MIVGFIVTGMTSLKYFIPIVEELNRRNKKSIFFIPEKCNGKYNSIFRNLDCFSELCNSFNIHVASLNDAHNFAGVLFQIEGDGLNTPISSQQKKIALTYMTDFSVSYEKYISTVDYVIFPSEKFANFYNKKSDKNLYLGCPKYGFKLLSREAVYNNFNLPEGKFCLYVAPRNRDKNLINETMIVSALKELDINVICKSRMKDPVSNSKIFDKVLYDTVWYPHDTLSLMKHAELVVNFNSTTIKEAVLMKKPVIDFKIKPKEHSKLPFLYEYNFCKNIANQNLKNEDHIKKSISELINFDASKFDFNKCIEECLFDIDNSVNKIVNFALSL